MCAYVCARACVCEHVCLLGPESKHAYQRQAGASGCSGCSAAERLLCLCMRVCACVQYRLGLPTHVQQARATSFCTASDALKDLICKRRAVQRRFLSLWSCRQAILRKAADRAVATAEWRQTYKFLSQEQLQEWTSLVSASIQVLVRESK